jgi:hypothetical protein
MKFRYHKIKTCFKSYKVFWSFQQWSKTIKSSKYSLYVSSLIKLLIKAFTTSYCQTSRSNAAKIIIRTRNVLATSVVAYVFWWIICKLFLKQNRILNFFTYSFASNLYLNAQIRNVRFWFNIFLINWNVSRFFSSIIFFVAAKWNFLKKWCVNIYFQYQDSDDKSFLYNFEIDDWSDRCSFIENVA